MPKRYKPVQVIKVLERRGFFFASQKGSHMKFKNDQGITTIIPQHKKEITPGTFSQILKQVGLTNTSFEALLKK